MPMVRKLTVWWLLSGLLGASLLVAAPTRAEQVRYLGAAIEVRDATIEPNSSLGGARGLTVSFRYRVGRITMDKALYLVAHFSTAQGKKVGALVRNKAFRDREGSLHGKTQLVTVPRNSWRKASLFVPFYAMKLAAGEHHLSVHLSALSDTGACKSGRPPRPVKVIGEARAKVSMTKPPYKFIELLVRQVQVATEATDVSLFRARKARPDLQWRVGFAESAGGILHTSKTRDDTYLANWTEYTTPFPLSEGDRVTISVLDRDVVSHDHLGSVTVSLKELVQRGPSSAPLKNSNVHRLILGSVKVSP